jgi:OOP family OmpA-OmpF porin
MNYLRNIYHYFLLLALSVVVVACSGGPAIQEFPDTANPGVELKKFEASLQEAYTNHVNVLAPENYEYAQDSYNEGRMSFDAGKKPKETLHHVARGKGYLDRAIDKAALAHSNLHQVIVARELAMKANAPKYLAEDFEEADEDLKEVTRDIEKNDLDDANEDKSSLQLAYLDLELRSLKISNLSSAEATILRSVEEGAEKYAPRSLALANKSVEDAKAYITTNRRDDARIVKMSNEAKYRADHLLRITRNAKAGINTTPEDNALEQESARIKVEMRDGEIVDQEKQLAGNRRTIGVLGSQNEELESKDLLNARYEQARKEFQNEEAEVYKQGKTLVIRLKGLEFPTAGSRISNDNLPLLSKVQKVITDFGDSSIVIEGHTDSVGEKKLNQALSTQRAQAVKTYFLGQSNGKNLEMTAVGMDFQKPLASNKSVSGRAQNRRVDVLIKPIE